MSGHPQDPDEPDATVPSLAGVLGGEGTLNAAVSIGLPPRTWQQRWQELLDRMPLIEEIYLGGPLHQSQQGMIVNFFKDCRELADWIENSGAATGAITHACTNGSALSIGNAVAQSDRHFTRTHGSDPMTAMVTSPASRANIVTTDVRWWTRSGSRGTEDALDLARRCVSEWREFLTLKGIQPHRG